MLFGMRGARWRAERCLCNGVNGPALSYHDNGDGTITDLNTGLMREKKCAICNWLHEVSLIYQLVWD